MTDSEKDRTKEKAQKVKKKRSPGSGYFLAMGIALGTGLGAVYDNIAIGIAIGVAIGLALERKK